MRKYRLAFAAAALAATLGTAVVAYAATVPNITITPEAPPAVQTFTSRLLGLAMYLTWIYGIYKSLMLAKAYMDGDKEAPRRGASLVAGVFILAMVLTGAYYWLFR